MWLKYSFLGSEYSFKEADFIVLPVLYGKACSFETPFYIIKESLNLPGFDSELKVNYRDIKIHTMDFFYPSIEPKKAIEEISEVIDYILSYRKIPVIIGGDHSITISTNFKRYFIIDAHYDLYDEYEGSKYSHACVGKRLIEKGAEVYYWGVREKELEENDGNLYNNQDDFYLSIDMDVLDVKTNVRSLYGKSLRELIDFIKTLKGKNVQGIDLVEGCPESAYIGASILAKTLAILNKKLL